MTGVPPGLQVALLQLEGPFAWYDFFLFCIVYNTCPQVPQGVGIVV